MFGSVAAWRTWAGERGLTGVPADDTTATQALVRASDHIEFFYVPRFIPPYDGTSPNVEIATYEAAMLEAATPGFFSKTFTPSEQKVLTEVKGIKWTPLGTGTSTRASTPVSTNVERALAAYMPVPDVPGVSILSVGGPTSE